MPSKQKCRLIAVLRDNEIHSSEVFAVLPQASSPLPQRRRSRLTFKLRVNKLPKLPWSAFGHDENS